MSKRDKMNKKPVYWVRAKTIINFKSKFSHKLLCDGLTFSTGSACVFGCAFCYVDAIMTRNPHTQAIRKDGQAFEDTVIRRRVPLAIVRKQLTDRNGNPKFANCADNRVIYASTLVDVAGNMELVRETVEVCKIILELTNWQIRLLSKCTLLYKIAEALADHRDRMIYGFSTGTLDDGIAKAFEKGTSRVSKRIEALHRLQDAGYRTFGMICPSLPQENYEAFAESMAEAIRVDRCEHVWAEVINVRGKAMKRTCNALREAGYQDEAKALFQVSSDKRLWEEYAKKTFLAQTQHISPDKLRFLQYVNKETVKWWKRNSKHGAVVLGTHSAPNIERSGK